MHGRIFGLRYDEVAEVMPAKPLTRVPGCPPHILGVLIHRRRLIPVVNLVADVPVDGAASPYIILAKGGEDQSAFLFGLSCESICGWANVTPSDVSVITLQGQPQHLYFYDDKHVELISASGFISELAPKSKATPALTVAGRELSAFDSQAGTWAIDTDEIIRFMAGAEIVPNSMLPASALGAANVDGEWIIVFDLEAVLYDRPFDPTPASATPEGFLVVRERSQQLLFGITASAPRRLGSPPAALLLSNTLVGDLAGRDQGCPLFLDLEDQPLEIFQPSCLFQPDAVAKIVNWRTAMTEIERLRSANAAVVEADANALTSYTVLKTGAYQFAIPTSCVARSAQTFEIREINRHGRRREYLVFCDDLKARALNLAEHFGIVEALTSPPMAIFIDLPGDALALLVHEVPYVVRAREDELASKRKFPLSVHPDLLHACVPVEDGFAGLLDLPVLSKDARPPLAIQLKALLGESAWA